MGRRYIKLQPCQGNSLVRSPFLSHSLSPSAQATQRVTTQTQCRRVESSEQQQSKEQCCTLHTQRSSASALIGLHSCCLTLSLTTLVAWARQCLLFLCCCCGTCFCLLVFCMQRCRRRRHRRCLRISQIRFSLAADRFKISFELSSKRAASPSNVAHAHYPNRNEEPEKEIKQTQRKYPNRNRNSCVSLCVFCGKQTLTDYIINKNI